MSPAPLNTLMPAAAAFFRMLSMLCTSAAVVWSSQYAQLLLMIVTPALIMALNIDWK